MDSATSRKAINNSLCDVRKAYRLLYQYQRVTLDAVGYIGDRLGLAYKGGYPRYSEPSPRNGKGKLDCWAWDWLNMMCYQFKFVGRDNNGKHQNFSVLLVSDTGHFLKGRTHLDKIDLNGYAPAEESETKIVLLFNTRGEENPGLHKDVLKQLPDILSEDEPKETDSGIFIAVYDYSRLHSQSSTDGMLNEFVTMLGACNPTVSLTQVNNTETR